jgi:hypothetical protein
MDYISREDAKTLLEFAVTDGWSFEYARKRFEQDLPVEDVVEVVRCKDCKYGVRPVLAGQMKCKQDGERWVFFDGYCDNAERREE